MLEKDNSGDKRKKTKDRGGYRVKEGGRNWREKKGRRSWREKNRGRGRKE